jgi:histidinol phosphatase-like PHP family hydrolase
MKQNSRRQFLGGAAALVASAARPFSASGQTADQSGVGFPLVDYHVHLNATTTLEQVLAVTQGSGVKCGILEHAGTKENQYPTVLSNDKELQDWIAKLEGKPVYKGVQAEWFDWMPCFSKDVFAQLDYVLTDTMTLRDASGKRVKAWTAAYVPGDDAEAFMKMYVDFNVEILEREPLDIFSHPTWLPTKFNSEFDKLWTAERMKTVVDALKRTGTACEIDTGMRLPKLPFLQMVKAAGVKFSIGSNSQGRTVSQLTFATDMIKALGLTEKDMFVPAPKGRKPIQVRKSLRT